MGVAQEHDPLEKVGLTKVIECKHLAENVTTFVNSSPTSAGGKNEKSSATTSSIDRDWGDKLAPVAIAAQNLHKTPLICTLRLNRAFQRKDSVSPIWDCSLR
jgi:hypothetical protein